MAGLGWVHNLSEFVEEQRMKVRAGLSGILLLAMGVYSFILFFLGRLAFAYGYHPQAHSVAMFVRYMQNMLVFPCFLLALLRYRWTTVPLWVVCTSICVFPFFIVDPAQRFLGYGNTSFDRSELKGIMLVMIIPVLVQIAVLLRGNRGHAHASEKDLGSAAD
jgi:hypothetical protein